jgi:hypothetical protein
MPSGRFELPPLPPQGDSEARSGQQCPDFVPFARFYPDDGCARRPRSFDTSQGPLTYAELSDVTARQYVDTVNARTLVSSTFELSDSALGNRALMSWTREPWARIVSMEAAHDEELRILRARAYGPGADIDADPGALERLHELEAAERESNSAVDRHVPEPVTDAVRVEPPQMIEEEADRSEPLGALRDRIVRIVNSVVAHLRSVRRSTWLIVVGVVVAASFPATALVLIQRVQTDPLQAGATQVARLSVDQGYEIPDFFGVQPGDEQRWQAFEEFHGLRTVLNLDGFSPFGSKDDCILIYAPTGITTTGGGFSGNFLSGCAAGDFPAMAQFRVDLDGFPAALEEAFPNSTGLQFVYDRQNNEVVVFASPRK